MDDRSQPSRERYLSSAALPVKDVLRGVRFGLRSFRNTAASLQSRLPGPIGTLGAATISHMDWLATQVDRNSSLVVHRYLDPVIAGDADGEAFSRLIEHPNASVLFAKIAYDHLKPVVSYLCETLDQDEDYFISEMLAALAYRRAAVAMADSPEGMGRAAVLLVSLMETGVIRTTTSSNAAYAEDDAERRLVRVACFTLMLWLVLERGAPSVGGQAVREQAGHEPPDREPENEELLLFTCCDLALTLASAIDEADDDADLLSALLQNHVGMV